MCYILVCYICSVIQNMWLGGTQIWSAEVLQSETANFGNHRFNSSHHPTSSLSAWTACSVRMGVTLMYIYYRHKKGSLLFLLYQSTWVMSFGRHKEKNNMNAADRMLLTAVWVSVAGKLVFVIVRGGGGNNKRAANAGCRTWSSTDMATIAPSNLIRNIMCWTKKDSHTTYNQRKEKRRYSPLISSPSHTPTCLRHLLLLLLSWFPTK